MGGSLLDTVAVEIQIWQGKRNSHLCALADMVTREATYGSAVSSSFNFAKTCIGLEC